MFDWFRKQLGSPGPSVPPLGEKLIDAATAGDVQVASDILAQGADVNWQSSIKATALMAAAMNGHDSLVELFLARAISSRGATGTSFRF